VRRAYVATRIRVKVRFAYTPAACLAGAAAQISEAPQPSEAVKIGIRSGP